MARIRSIKPDFFTSETIARLPVSARLTFIGLWTHVDDNGVCRANELLIAAALYPLDGMDGIQRTREDLRSLSREALVTLYEHETKRYLWVTSWDEHQKVSHPGKARYPRPDHTDCKLVTWDNEPLPERHWRPSGDSPETLAPEQGAGSRSKGSKEQGAGKVPSAAPPTDTLLDVPTPFERFYAAYPLKKERADAEKAFDKALKRPGVTAEQVIGGAERYRDDPGRKPEFTKHPATWLNKGCWDDEPTPVQTSGRREVYRNSNDPNHYNDLESE